MEDYRTLTRQLSDLSESITEIDERDSVVLDAIATVMDYLIEHIVHSEEDA